MSVQPIDSPAALRRLTGADFTVSDQQWAAISADPVPGVVIAGAGSGKTELMSARVIYLVANGHVRPDQVLGLTFTTKATAELAQRVRTALARAGLDRGPLGETGEPGERLEPVISTYNAYAANLLAEHGLRIGHEQDLRLMADASRFQLAQRVIAAHTATVRHLSDHPPTVIKYLLALDGAMSEHLVSPEQVREFHASQRPGFEAVVQLLLDSGGRTKTKQDELRGVLARMDQREELLDLVGEYRALKQSYGLLDFSDQISGAFRLASEFDEVGVAEREKYRVVLLDEYQDTSVAQARLLVGLFSGPDAASGRGHAVTAVGDPNQAIYGWRGASVANIQQFRTQFPQAGGGEANLFSLTVNRRSDRRILELANTLATPLLSEAGALVAPLQPKPDAVEGTIRTALHRTDTDELRWLAEQVTAAHEAGTPWGEIGILVRTNKHGAEAYDVLSAAEIPVEIVGLAGLIRLPEVAQVVSTLSLLEDLTDNAALLNLLVGPRWEIGTRDLALLGRRSEELARIERGTDIERSVAEQLSDSVAGADPTEMASLSEALESPGELPYSPEALDRFARLADELSFLRGFVGEPLLDLLRRIMDVTGLDTELASSLSPAADARRENLDLFVKAVADFQAVDGTVTLGALNAWLATEDEEGGGLDLAPPSESDAVKLLTIHRAKGLEYDVVFQIGVAETRFPNTQLRSQWTTVSSVLPGPLRGDADSVPQARGQQPGDLKSKFVAKGEEDDSLERRAREHQSLEELRLGYVAFTRARHEFVVSSHVWGSTQKPLAPSPYLLTVRELQHGWQVEPEAWYVPQEDEQNPRQADPVSLPWPGAEGDPERGRREQVAALVRSVDLSRPEDESGFSEAEADLVARWDTELDRLLAEAQAGRSGDIEVLVPGTLSASGLLRLRNDPDGFAADLLRPMPRQPAPAARFGTQFHAWVEARVGQQQLLDPDDLPGRADTGIEDEADLAELQGRFESGAFADRAPYAVEAPFALVLGSQVVRGRIDAVYLEPDGSHLVIDWKTNRFENADEFQLGIYRVAWAELTGLPLDRVQAAFHYVRSGRTVRPGSLPDRAALEAALRLG